MIDNRCWSNRKEKIMNIFDVVIDAQASVGNKLLLTGVRPYYVYSGNQKSDKISGYKYEIAMAERKFEKISVKIEGAQQVTLDDSCDYLPVRFENLQLKLYFLSGSYHITATASNIHVIKHE